MFKVNNKDSVSNVSIVNFEQVNAGWDINILLLLITLNRYFACWINSWFTNTFTKSSIIVIPESVDIKFLPLSPSKLLLLLLNFLFENGFPCEQSSSTIMENVQISLIFIDRAFSKTNMVADTVFSTIITVLHP